MTKRHIASTLVWYAIMGIPLLAFTFGDFPFEHAVVVYLFIIAYNADKEHFTND